MRTLLSRIAIVLCLLILSPTQAWGEDVPPDGFFVDDAALDTPHALSIKRATLRSVDNDNRRFQLSIITPWTPTPGPEVVLRVNGRVFKSRSRGASEGKDRSHGFVIEGEAVAKEVAAHLGIKAELRVHPGHRLLTRLEVDKEVFVAGEAIEASIVIKNVGTTAVRFMDGGQNRGPRNNQFTFAAQRDNKPLPDEGDPMNFGGLAVPVELAPGEVFTKKVNLASWYNTQTPGHYNLFGAFYLNHVDAGSDFKTLWEDHATGQVYFRIKASP